MKVDQLILCGTCKTNPSEAAFSVPQKSQYKCSQCSRCANCRTPSNKLNSSGLCSECVCIGCGKAIGRFKKDPAFGPQCPNCYAKTHPDEVCRICRGRLAVYHQHGDKLGKPSLCEYCVNRDGEPVGFGLGMSALEKLASVRCFYCEGLVETFKQLNHKGTVYGFALCDQHGNLIVCSKRMNSGKECTPINQCDVCKIKQKSIDNPDGHLRDNPNCGCGKCIKFKRSDLFIFENPNLVFHNATDRNDRRYNRSQRCAGVEIEVAGIKDRSQSRAISDVARNWQMSGIVRDASLVDDGFEIMTAPASGDILLAQIDEIAGTLKKAGAFVDKKCGLHVHVDLRDHTYHDLKKLALLYAKVEPALIRTQPFQRVMVDKSHCYPCGEKYVNGLALNMLPREARKKIVDNVYGGYTHGFGRSYTTKPPRTKRGNNREVAARYNALNLHSFFTPRKTAEWRLHTGTIRGDKIKKWTLICVSIVDTAYALSEQEIRGLKGTPDEILYNIVPAVCVEYIRNRIREFGKAYGPMTPVLI